MDVDSCTKSGSESFESAHVHFNLQNCFPTSLKYGSWTCQNEEEWGVMSGRCMDFRYSTCLQTLCPVHIFGEISRWRPCLEAHHCIHWLIPSRQALVCFEFYECFSFTRCVDSTWRNKLPWLIIPNYHLGAIMTSSGVKPPQMLVIFFVHHPMLCFCSFPSPSCSTFFSCSGVLLGEHSNTAWSIANDGWNISGRSNHIQPERLDSADSECQ